MQKDKKKEKAWSWARGFSYKALYLARLIPTSKTVAYWNFFQRVTIQVEKREFPLTKFSLLLVKHSHFPLSKCLSLAKAHSRSSRSNGQGLIVIFRLCIPITPNMLMPGMDITTNYGHGHIPNIFVLTLSFPSHVS